MVKRLAASAALALIACDPGAATGPNASSSPDEEFELQVRLTGGGLDVARRSLHPFETLEFGEARERVVDRVAEIRGRPSASGRNEDCPSGAIDFVSFGAFDLYFADGRFVGWLVDGPTDPPVREEYGLGIGTSRAEVENIGEDVAFASGTLGPEFSWAGIGGLLDGEGSSARVTTLYSGITCLAR